MTDSTEKDLWFSWSEYYLLIEKLAQQVHESAWDFDCILCLARGGLRPGDVFSRIFNRPLAILATSSYRENAGQTQGDLDIAKFITITRGELQGKVLLIDDLVDSGVTFQGVQEHLRQQYAAITEVKTAVIWYKASSACRPDYFVQHLVHNPWVHQPFEQYDSLRPAQLEAWIRKTN